MKTLPSLVALALCALTLGACEPSQPGWIFQPFAGPGVADDGTLSAKPGEDGRFVVATTYLPVRPESQALFQDTMAPVQEVIEDGPAGLVGYSLARALDGDAYRTLSVWETYDAMYAFVLGDAHAGAMARAQEIAVQGEARAAHWEAAPDEVPPRWPDVIARLDEDTETAAP